MKNVMGGDGVDSTLDDGGGCAAKPCAQYVNKVLVTCGGDSSCKCAIACSQCVPA